MGDETNPGLDSVLQDLHTRAGYEQRTDLYRDLEEMWGGELRAKGQTYKNWYYGNNKANSWVPMVQLGVTFAKKIKELPEGPDRDEFTIDDLNVLLHASGQDSIDTLLKKARDGEFDNVERSALRKWVELNDQHQLNNQRAPDRTNRRMTKLAAGAVVLAIAVVGTIAATRDSSDVADDTAIVSETTDSTESEPAAPTSSDDGAPQSEPPTTTPGTASTTTTQAEPEPSSTTQQLDQPDVSPIAVCRLDTAAIPWMRMQGAIGELFVPSGDCDRFRIKGSIGSAEQQEIPVEDLDVGVTAWKDVRFRSCFLAPADSMTGYDMVVTLDNGESLVVADDFDNKTDLPIDSRITSIELREFAGASFGDSNWIAACSRHQVANLSFNG